MSVIELNSLTKYYGKTKGIEDLTFSVQEGEIFGFIGPNGAGKSTTIRTLLSLIFPTSGSARIFGKDCIKHARKIAEDVGYLPSEVFYYDKMSVKDLLKYSASFYKKNCTERINRLCDILEVDKNKRIGALSYDNRKKIGIIQGLLHNPNLIMLDEPTNDLTLVTQQKFYEIIRSENKNGATVFFASDNLNEIQRLCHRVAIIKEGRLLSVMDINELKQNNYKDVYIEVNGRLNKEDLAFDGVARLVLKENSAKFMYKGNADSLMKNLSGFSLSDISIETPSLEDVFVCYYPTD